MKTSLIVRSANAKKGALASEVFLIQVSRRFGNYELSREEFAANGHAGLQKQMRLHLPTARQVRAAAIDRRMVVTLPNAASLAVTVATTDLIAVVPRRYAEIVAPIHRLRILPVPFEYPKSKIFLGWATEKGDDAGLRWLLNQIRSTFSN